jgi:hypothetical protein
MDMIKLRRVLLAGPDDLAISSAVASISPNSLPQTAAEPRPIWEPPAQNPMFTTQYGGTHYHLKLPAAIAISRVRPT